MKIYIVRHGQTDYNKNRLIQGHIDVPLNNYGKEQAILTATHFINEPIDLIISSPLSRAYETAQIIAKEVNYQGEIIIDEHFRERNFGEADGQSIPVIIERVRKGEVVNLESEKDLVARVVKGLNNLKEKYPDKTILIVCHSQTIKAILMYINPELYNLDTYLRNCSISLIEYKNQKWEVVYANYNDYI